MDDITLAVRELYEAFPYPSQAEGVVADVHPKLMLSYVERSQPSRPLEILDAGCGTGMACLGTAMCNPTCHVTAVDVNRVALDRVREQAERLGLKNLRLLELDLMALDGLPRPSQGYDLIVSSGVLHHLSRPESALQGLAGLLHREGVMRLMVYNRWGRQPVYRFVQALELFLRPDADLSERLQDTRALIASLLPGPVNAPPWDDGATVSDVELVDRFLHPNDQSYSVSELLAMVGEAGLKMLRWYEPRHWHPASICQGPMAERLAALPREQLYSMVELLGCRKQMDLILCHPDAQPRPPAVGPVFALSPQVTWISGRRVGAETLFTFASSVILREGPERPLSSEERAVLECLGATPMAVERLFVILRPLMGPELLTQVLQVLLADEILYCPD